MANQELIGLSLKETLTGFVALDCQDPVEGHAKGEKAGTGLTMTVQIAIDSVAHFIRDPEHEASLEGTVDYGPAGGERQIDRGTFNVFVVDPTTGERQMVYRVLFTTANGQRWCLCGRKHVRDDPGFDVLKDLTTLFVTLHAGDTPDDPTVPIVGAGQIFFHLTTAPKMLASLKATGTTKFTESIRAKVAFLSFVLGQVRDVYLADINPLYHAAYQNLVLTGQLRDGANKRKPFFLVAGTHTPDFPWGDGESMCDIMLIIQEDSGQLRRFALTRRRIEDMHLDLVEGRFRFAGDVIDLTDRARLAFSEVAQGHGLPTARVDIDLHFEAIRHDVAPFPFRIRSHILDRLATHVRDTLTKILPAESLLGFQILPHAVVAREGTMRIQGDDYELVPEASFGEAEDTTINNVREPTLLYGYMCAPIPSTGQSCVQFHASSLRNHRDHWTHDRVDEWLGALVSHFCAAQMVVDPDSVAITDLADPDQRKTGSIPLRRMGPPVIELVNDHFPTAIFQRRVVVVETANGERCLALEEAMDTLRCEAINSDRTAVVAAIRYPDKFVALDAAVRQAGLFAALDEKCHTTGKARADLRIVIKPNFMFTYDRLDHTTYTDPELVEAFIKSLQKEGYGSIQVVEAHSTYGEYFENRDVRAVAAYVGYAVDGSRGYQVVDLTDDAHEILDLGPHLGRHPVPNTWRQADFRISFAKNKTHSYAFYTLTLKNVYGSLCLANKFKEYHVGRDIYCTTIEYLKAFPVHFGIIDAHKSADGPFGIFADTEPNLTETILASRDLVAVDWVGATKMGLDPRISPYMRHAVDAFGKPRIEFVGDASVYHPWLNVSHAVTLFAHLGIDANDHFGNLFYASAAHMDAKAFPLKPTSKLVDVTRALMEPIRETAFLQADGHKTWANRLMNRFFNWLGS
jgi:uncharacterized protein (DUF362 family)